MPETKAFVFDIGATLVTGPPVAPNKVIAALLVDVTPKEVASVIMTRELDCGERAVSALRECFGEISEADQQAVCELWESQRTAPVPIRGAAETVLALKREGFKVGLLSDIWTPYFLGACAAIPGVIEAADSITLSCRTGHRKPEAFNFMNALDGLGVEPGEAVMVGDTYEHDIQPALELGMKAVWVLCRPDREAESAKGVMEGSLPMPTRTIFDITELAAPEVWRSL